MRRLKRYRLAKLVEQTVFVIVYSRVGIDGSRTEVKQRNEPGFKTDRRRFGEQYSAMQFAHHLDFQRLIRRFWCSVVADECVDNVETADFNRDRRSSGVHDADGAD